MDKRTQDLLSDDHPKERDGWIYLRISGGPYERGFQHGYHLAPQIADAFRVNKYLTWWNTGNEWEYFIEQAYRLYANLVEDEYVEEMQGIADGACANGCQTTYEEILLWNSYNELLGSWWPVYNNGKKPGLVQGHRCSSFIATGSHTKDNKIVLAHNTWDVYANTDHFNIVLDINPTDGYRMLMQAPPGYINSGMDWWITGAGLMISETTMDEFAGYDVTGAPEFCRVRKAGQYAHTIEQWKNIMWQNNNGGYANSWLVGDAKTNEIAQVEIGLQFLGYHTTTDGYYSGFNEPDDPKIRNQECTGSTYLDIRFNGSRRLRFMQLLDKEYPGIKNKPVDLELAKEIIADHHDVYLDKPDNPCSRTICGHLELEDAKYGSHAGAAPYYPWGASDGKVTDSDMALDMKFQGRWGHACGMEFDAGKFLDKHMQYNWLRGYMKSRPSCQWQTFGGI